MSSSDRAPGSQADPATRYLGLLVEGKTEELLALFAEEPKIHDPLQGDVLGGQATARFVEDYRSWLAGQEARVEHLRTTREAGRAVAESALHLIVREVRGALPVAVVGEDSGAGHLRKVRTYHSTWPLTGGHQIRSPLLEAKPDLVVPDVV